MVEPFALLVIKFRTGFRHAIEGEILNQFLHRVELFVSASVPAEEGEEVDDCFRQVTGFAIAAGDGAILLIMELEREDRKTESVSITFG